MTSELFRKIGEKEVYVVRDNKGRIVVSDEMFNSLIDAFEKQTPKKILRGTVERDMACYCPNCKEFVCFEDADKHSYCHNCGQRLEW